MFNSISIKILAGLLKFRMNLMVVDGSRFVVVSVYSRELRKAQVSVNFSYKCKE